VQHDQPCQSRSTRFLHARYNFITDLLRAMCPSPNQDIRRIDTSLFMIRSSSVAVWYRKAVLMQRRDRAMHAVGVDLCHMVVPPFVS